MYKQHLNSEIKHNQQRNTMIKLKCHRKDGSLIDIIDIRSVIIKIATITEWMIAVEWCTGENASEIDKTALNPIFLNDAEFVEYYKGITQTIDGHFAIESNFGHIEASIIDSSYWEIECENIKVINQIKSEMKEK